MLFPAKGKPGTAPSPTHRRDRGCPGPASRLEHNDRLWEGSVGLTRGTPGASHLRHRGEGRARRRPHRRPGGSRPPPTRHGTRARRPPRAPPSRHDTTAGSGAPFPTAAAARGCTARERAPPPRPGRRGGVRGGQTGRDPSDSPRARRPDPEADRRYPRGSLNLRAGTR